MYLFGERGREEGIPKGCRAKEREREKSGGGWGSTETLLAILLDAGVQRMVYQRA